jgi:hypothetical protein
MIKTIPIILIFLNTLFGFNFRNQHANISFIKEKQIIYYSEFLDSISIYNDIYCRMEFSTRRDISQFQKVLQNKFGKPKRMEQYWDDEHKCGKFQWKNVDLEGFKNLEIIIDILPGNEYIISISVFNNEKINITTDPKIEKYFRKLIMENILTQPIKIIEIGRSMPLHINLDKIITFNKDSLQSVFDKYFSLDTIQINAKISVDKEGNITKTEINAPYKLIPEVENFISQLNMPIIIYQEARDTAIYEVTWDFTCSEKHIIELIKEEVQQKLSEKCWYDMDTINIDFIGNIANKYMYGNFFEKDKIHCIIYIPEYNSLYIYICSENMFVEKAHISTDPYYDYFYLEDVTFDHYPEITTTTYPNMNGNCFVSVYSFNNEELNFVGHWTYGETTFNKDKKEIYEEYGGSWYDPALKTVYGLINNKYIPKRQIGIKLKEEAMECQDQILYYLENPFFESGFDTLVLKMNVLYNEKNKSQQILWNNFFDEKNHDDSLLLQKEFKLENFATPLCNLNDMIFKTYSTTIFEKKFNFSKIATKTDINTKIDFVIENIISKDTNSIHFYTQLDSYHDLVKIRQNYQEIFLIMDTSEINRNLHFIDFNFDGELDCVYDRLNLADDNLQYIFLFLKKDGQYTKTIIPGFFITKYYEKEGSACFESYKWACCEEQFHYYCAYLLKGYELIEKNTYLIPVNLRIRNLFNQIGELNKNKKYFIYEDYENPFYLKEKNVPIQIIGKNIKVFDSFEINNITWKLIEGEIYDSKLSSNRNKIIGWIKDE